RLGKGQSSALFHFMFASLSALFLSLFAAVLLVSAASEDHIVWQMCNTLSGLTHLVGGGRVALETSQHRTEVVRSSAASAIGLGNRRHELCGSCRLSDPSGSAHFYAGDALGHWCNHNLLCLPASFRFEPDCAWRVNLTTQTLCKLRPSA